jgi:hypothetical protein
MANWCSEHFALTRLSTHDPVILMIRARSSPSEAAITNAFNATPRHIMREDLNDMPTELRPNMEEVAAFVESVAFRGVRLEVNLSKSSATWKGAVASVFPGTQLRVTGGGDQFTMLGASITGDCDEMTRQKEDGSLTSW